MTMIKHVTNVNLLMSMIMNEMDEHMPNVNLLTLIIMTESLSLSAETMSPVCQSRLAQGHEVDLT